MAPVLFCKCTQCVCTATVLINTVKENPSAPDKFQDLSQTTNNYSSFENFEAQATSTVMHPIVSGNSRGGPEILIFTLLIFLILICE